MQRRGNLQWYYCYYNTGMFYFHNNDGINAIE